MKEQIIDKLIQYIEQSKDFILDQAPEVLLQTLRYQKTSNWFGMFISLLMIIILISIAFYIFMNPKFDKYDSRDFFSVFGVLVPSLISIPFFCAFLSCTDTLMKLYLAPKYFLLEHFLKMK